MEKEKKKLNLKIIIPVIVVIAIIGIIVVTNQNKGNEETKAETVTEKELHQVGETVTDDDLEITLKSFKFVDSVYDSNAITYPVSSFSNSEPSSGNALIEVNYTIKNIGKQAQNLGLAFGGVDYNNGYLFTYNNPVGIHLVKCGNTVTKTMVNTSLQPLSEAVEVVAFLEVPKEVKENTSAPLIYNCWTVSYKIR